MGKKHWFHFRRKKARCSATSRLRARCPSPPPDPAYCDAFSEPRDAPESVPIATPAALISAIDSIPLSQPVSFPWLLYTFADTLPSPLVLLESLPLLREHPRFCSLFLRPDSLEYLVNRLWLLMPAGIRLPESLLNVKLAFLELLSNCVVEAMREGVDISHVQLRLFKFPICPCSLGLEHRFFCILAAHYLRTSALVPANHLLLSLVHCFPPSSPLRAVAIEFILRHARPGFPFWRLAEVMETQGFRDHRDLQLFVKVLNKCDRKANATAAVTLLALTADPLLGRAAVSLVESEVSPGFWLGDVTHAALTRWLTRLIHAGPSPEHCSFLGLLASLRVQALADLLRCLTERSDA
jgi:hypothetical protein